MAASEQSCVLASGNKGKLAELSNALAPLHIKLTAQSEYNVSEADETAVTFIENALIKARHACQSTGLPALADDSGLVVPILNGAPGIYSARYAKEEQAQADDKPTDRENIDKLLLALQNHSGDARRARFVCVLAFLEHAEDPEPVIAIGHWSGSITTSVEGDGGFGYDPVFYCPQTRMTAAAMGKERKASISHRSAAIKSLLQQLSHRYPKR
jgi:XTP/dITP diphosphohydrolase